MGICLRPRAASGAQDRGCDVSPKLLGNGADTGIGWGEKKPSQLALPRYRWHKLLTTGHRHENGFFCCFLGGHACDGSRQAARTLKKRAVPSTHLGRHCFRNNLLEGPAPDLPHH